MKRAFDVLVSFLMLFLLFPIGLIIGAHLTATIGRPVFFCQNRPGLNGEPFQMIKFRTMTEARDNNNKILPDSDRLTKFGKFLRSTSLDEIPEFWNVLKGDMSLVGPRPLLMEYLPLYSPEQFRRHSVRPGITGWAQVNGRNAISWEEKFKLDNWYVDNKTFWLDIKILFMTISKVFFRKNINAQSEATVARFRGSLELED